MGLGNPPVETDVIVIGGGLAGLTCAVGLCESGLKVTVLERGTLLGGRARSWVHADSGDTVDIGPHVLTNTCDNMLRLLQRLGTRKHVVWQQDKLITLVDRGHALDMRAAKLPAPFHFIPSLLRASKHAQLSRQDILSNRRVSQLAMRLDEKQLLRLDHITAEEFLRRQGVTPRFIEWFWASMSMTVAQLPLSVCSAAALLRHFRMLVGHRDLRFGFPGVGLGNLFASQAEDMIVSSGGQVLRESRVARFLTNDDGIAGVELADARRIHARFCVSAVAPQDLRALVPSQWAQQHADSFGCLIDFEPNPCVSVYLWFDRKLTHERFWSRLWSPTHLNYDFHDLSNIRFGWTDRPSLIASNIMFSHRARNLSDDEIVDATIRELGEFIPRLRCAGLRHAAVNRISMATPCPYPGTESKRPPAATPIKGLVLAGDWVRTDLPANMESAVRSGWLAAEEVLRQVGRPKRLAEPVRHVSGAPGLMRRFPPVRDAQLAK